MLQPLGLSLLCRCLLHDGRALDLHLPSTAEGEVGLNQNLGLCTAGSWQEDFTGKDCLGCCCFCKDHVNATALRVSDDWGRGQGAFFSVTLNHSGAFFTCTPTPISKTKRPTAPRKYQRDENECLFTPDRAPKPGLPPPQSSVWRTNEFIGLTEGKGEIT